jgi:orotate phosphoribosyltransferase
MDDQQILAEFEQAKAILKGHFILSSGLHSDTYVQCAKVLTSAKRAEKLCAALAKKITTTIDTNAFDLIVSPAMGGVVVGYEMGRQLGCDSLFCERVNGIFQLRRGFEIKPGTRILVVEDVLTTGKSSLETFKCVEDLGGIVVAEACLIDRSSADTNINIPLISLIKLNIQTFTAENIPPHLINIDAIKPGSRFIAN